MCKLLKISFESNLEFEQSFLVEIKEFSNSKQVALVKLQTFAKLSTCGKIKKCLKISVDENPKIWPDMWLYIGKKKLLFLKEGCFNKLKITGKIKERIIANVAAADVVVDITNGGDEWVNSGDKGETVDVEMKLYSEQSNKSVTLIKVELFSTDRLFIVEPQINAAVNNKKGKIWIKVDFNVLKSEKMGEDANGKLLDIFANVPWSNKTIKLTKIKQQYLLFITFFI